jgi:hypothetical protein
MCRIPSWLVFEGGTIDLELVDSPGASLAVDSNTRRAIDIREGEKIDEKALNALLREAVALNES